jgi:mono/diheme cytochrome c family protein
MRTATFHRNLVIAAVAAFFVLFPVRFMAADAAPPDNLSDGDNQCLGCHGIDGFKKELAGGKILSLRIQADGFAKSVHGVIGCASCHADVDLKTHSQKPKTIASTRDYSIAMAKICGGCHAEALKQNETSVHATLLASGNLSAPVCTDCHSSHAVSPKTAYDTCVGCHLPAMEGHQKWLPNAGLHLEVVSCAACHAPAAQRMVDLRLYDGVAKKWVSEKEGGPGFEKMARAVDTDGNGLDAMELRKLMGQINLDDAVQPKNLRGRIELRTGVEAHQLSGKIKAIKDCASCHQQGAEPFQNVTISIVSANGKPVRYKAQKEVLGSVLSVDSLREFYAVGGTRNALLDILLVLAVLAGLSVPIGHQILKRIVKKQLERDAQQGGATKPKGKDQP